MVDSRAKLICRFSAVTKRVFCPYLGVDRMPTCCYPAVKTTGLCVGTLKREKSLAR